MKEKVKGISMEIKENNITLYSFPIFPYTMYQIFEYCVNNIFEYCVNNIHVEEKNSKILK